MKEVKHAKKDYYVGMPILTLKQIEWLVERVNQLEVDLEMANWTIEQRNQSVFRLSEKVKSLEN